jgi:hypothetical protein
MDIKKVFLSSTAKDLEACREEASKAINRFEGYHCVRMEDFGARDSAPIKVCIKKVQECDVLVGIVGHLYGSCPKGSDKSYTELEYEAAFSTNKPRIMLLASAEFPFYAYQIEEPDKHERQKRFRERVSQDRCQQEFSKPHEVAPAVMAGLHNLEVDRKAAATDMAVSVKPTSEEGTASPALATGVAAQAMQDEASRQRLEAIDATRQSLVTQQSDSSAPSDHILSSFDVARVFLTAKALFSRHCSRESLSVHEANVLYVHREKLRAGGWERELLWETLLGEHEGIVPGWYWFNDFPAESLTQYLWFLAFRGSEE